MLTPRLQQLLDQAHAQHLLRERHAIDQRHHHEVTVNGMSGINFCSNDYLNLAMHPTVVNAVIEGARTFGIGSGSAPHLSGYSKAHQALEEAFAAFLGRDAAILFNSGYHANLGVIATLADRHTHIVADKLCHASIIDGMVLSRARCLRYAHRNTTQAATLLANSTANDKLLITESVFSMEGNIADLPTLAAIAKKERALFVVDDAHAIGVLGEKGRGSLEHFQLNQHDVPCLITPLGKAPGSFGAIVSGDRDLMEALLQLSRTYRYSTSIPATLCYATLAALKVIESENWRRLKLTELAKLFQSACRERQLPLLSTDLTPIQSILIGDNQKTVQLQAQLAARGLLVSCIRPPTVPINTARIRVSLCISHTEAHIMQLLDTLSELHAR